MKTIKLLTVFAIFIGMTSCVSVKVASDYDQKTDFNNYKTFAFYKKGIDKAEISDLDKKRILRAIESQLTAKGLTKSDKPDVLINIFTKSRNKVNVYQNNRFGMWNPWMYGGWGPWGWGGMYDYGTSVSTSVEGTLFIDIIDANKKELAWQGMGTGYLVSSKNVAKKEARINEFVTEIMTKYPPTLK